jgi:purine-binding chemotaxis protein CheW
MADAPLRRVLGMRVGNDLYGAGIEHVNEIIKLPPITFVPGAAPHILGVASVRGQIVPVINLRRLLSTTGNDNSPRRAAGSGVDAQAKPRVVVVHREDRLAGLLVDAVTEVYDLRVPLEPPLGMGARSAQLKEGQVPLADGRMLILLHIPTLFTQMES